MSLQELGQLFFHRLRGFQRIIYILLPTQIENILDLFNCVKYNSFEMKKVHIKIKYKTYNVYVDNIILV